MDCRILKNKKCIITQEYNSSHPALDIVGSNYTLDHITSHSDGIITVLKDGLGNMKGSIGSLAYGNYVKIEHQNGYSTLYAHMQNDLPVKNNQLVKKGQVIGYMSDSGNAYGKHLHFEVYKGNERINPNEFLNKDFLSSTDPADDKYKVGDIVEINGVYVSSVSKEKLRPLITRGTITKILDNTPNPYLLDNGNIGWVNDNTIISKKENKYLSNKNYQGTSIVDALKEINVNSSYSYRNQLAKKNNIENYQGSTVQNIKLLNLLKEGKLKY